LSHRIALEVFFYFDLGFQFGFLDFLKFLQSLVDEANPFLVGIKALLKPFRITYFTVG
jgi:hypothetical protein